MNQRSILRVFVTLGILLFSLNAQRSYLGMQRYVLNRSEDEPMIFAPGVISTGDHESHPTFTPDGNTVYFLKNSPTFSFWTIVVSQFRNGKWTVPKVAPFSGRYRDADPFITPDGSKFYFISDRPVAGRSSADLDIYVMERVADHWGEPKNLGLPVNSTGNEWYPTIAADGTIYFGSDRPGGKGMTDLYRCRYVNGTYHEAENLGEVINTKFNEFEPYIAPDQSYLIFMAGGRSDSLGGFDLYISFNRNGTWTKPVNLGSKINSPANEFSPSVSMDGKFFFWSSTRELERRPPETPLNYAQLTNRIRSPGNGLGDIYHIQVRALHLGI
jgi:Tol biopolymer transport system component